MSTQPESQLSRQLMDYIRARGGFALKIHGGPTMTAGTPDILACYKGRFVGLEVKMPSGRGPTAIQLHRIHQIRKAGGVASVVRSKEDVYELLKYIDSSIC